MPQTNLPGQLAHRTGNRYSFLLGAVPFLPDRTEAARRVLERFLALQG